MSKEVLRLVRGQNLRCCLEFVSNSFQQWVAVLHNNGINTFFAETTGNYAKAALGLKLEVGMTVNVHLVVDARKWQTQQGEDRYENRVTITNIARWE